MFDRTKAEEQVNRHKEVEAAEHREVAIRKLQTIKDSLEQLRRQYQELRLLLEDKYEVLPYRRYGFAEVNTILDRKLGAKDPIRTENNECYKNSFASLHASDAKHGKPISHLMEYIHLSIDRSSLAILFLISSGLAVLVWIGWLTWYDITTWSKDVMTVFFGSRTGEAISLGIGMKVIYYFVAGLVLLSFGLISLLRKLHQTNPRKEHAQF